MSGGEFAAIEARVKAATEGPWRVWSGSRHEDEAAVETAWAYEGDEEVELVTDCCSIVNAEFIAHSRTDIETLLAAVRERDNTIARIQALADRADFIAPCAGAVLTSALRAALDPQETE